MKRVRACNRSAPAPPARAQDFLGALDVVGAAQASLKSQLSQVMALRHTAAQLVEYEKLVHKFMGDRWVESALAWDGGFDHDDGLADDGANGDSGRGAVNSDASVSKLTEYFAPLVSGLLRAGEMVTVLSA